MDRDRYQSSKVKEVPRIERKTSTSSRQANKSPSAGVGRVLHLGYALALRDASLWVCNWCVGRAVRVRLLVPFLTAVRFSGLDMAYVNSTVA